MLQFYDQIKVLKKKKKLHGVVASVSLNLWYIGFRQFRKKAFLPEEI